MTVQRFHAWYSQPMPGGVRNPYSEPLIANFWYSFWVSVLISIDIFSHHFQENVQFASQGLLQNSIAEQTSKNNWQWYIWSKWWFHKIQSYPKAMMALKKLGKHTVRSCGTRCQPWGKWFLYKTMKLYIYQNHAYLKIDEPNDIIIWYFNTDEKLQNLTRSWNLQVKTTKRGTIVLLQGQDLN